MGGGATHVNLPTIQSKTSSTILPATLSPSSSSSTVAFPVSINNNASPLNLAQFSSTASSSCHCSCETGCVHGKDHKRVTGSVYYDVFASVPSQVEVETAIAGLNNFMKEISSSGHGYERVKDAFHSLQRDPTIKRLVVSLSSDKAVWSAIMRNEMLQQLRGSYTDPETYRIQGCDQEMDVVTFIFNWIMNITKSKVTELMQKFQSLMNEIIQVHEMEGKPAGESREEEVDDRIRSSLLLSVVILMVVVVARVQRP